MKKSLDKIIKTSIKNIEKRYKNITPNIKTSYFYGEYNCDSSLLSIIYIFDKDIDLESAQSMKLTDDIECATIKELVGNGYPESAFDVADKMNKNCVNISFVSNEDIQNKADGNIFLYLK